ncbi:hypothetical protein GCM10027217_31060 [Pseudomaricurvus hydrocarbonicus]
MSSARVAPEINIADRISIWTMAVLRGSARRVGAVWCCKNVLSMSQSECALTLWGPAAKLSWG